MGCHQGAAAALISPKPATTFSGHTWGEEETKRRDPPERKNRTLVSWRKRRHKKFTREASTSLLPPRVKLPAPTAMQQLRAASYSCKSAGNKNQYRSAASHCTQPPLTLPSTLTLLLTPCTHWRSQTPPGNAEPAHV
ncbi:hypothetical protein PBY51_000546 [Eleginops maclovinus]|uniref:Uncharacterized protein n=1 Tax=Eleginops maclovinus TaxID=56733 RepID=A0AAN8AP94_ELEMC|nr:hypothetical protein PBY51_000546 [Eleginops maclovinus]